MSIRGEHGGCKYQCSCRQPVYTAWNVVDSSPNSLLVISLGGRPLLISVGLVSQSGTKISQDPDSGLDIVSI
jgi:hypothetical protein